MKKFFKLLFLLTLALPIFAVQAQAQKDDEPQNVLIQFQSTTFTDTSFDVTIDEVLFPQLIGGEWLNITSGIHDVTITQRPRECEQSVDIDLPVRFTTPDLGVGTYILGMNAYTVISDDAASPNDTADITLFHEYGIFRVPPEVIGRAFVPMTNTAHPDDTNFSPFDVYFKGSKVFSDLKLGEAVLMPYENGTPRIFGGIEFSLPITNTPVSKFSFQDPGKLPVHYFYDPEITRTLVFGDFTAGPVGPVDITTFPLQSSNAKTYVNALYSSSDCLKQSGIDKKSVSTWIDNSGVNSLAAAFDPSLSSQGIDSLLGMGDESIPSIIMSKPVQMLPEYRPVHDCDLKSRDSYDASGQMPREQNENPCWVRNMFPISGTQPTPIVTLTQKIDPDIIAQFHNLDAIRWDNWISPFDNQKGMDFSRRTQGAATVPWNPPLDLTSTPAIRKLKFWTVIPTSNVLSRILPDEKTNRFGYVTIKPIMETRRDIVSTPYATHLNAPIITYGEAFPHVDMPSIPRGEVLPPL